MSRETSTRDALPWLDFSEIKANADVEEVLTVLGVRDQLQEYGKEELKGWCPLGTKAHGKRDSFSVNRTKKVFQCFACKNRGSIIDLVARVRNLHIREAAAIVDEITRGVYKPPESEEAPETAREAREEPTKERPKPAVDDEGDESTKENILTDDVLEEVIAEMEEMERRTIVFLERLTAQKKALRAARR